MTAAAIAPKHVPQDLRVQRRGDEDDAARFESFLVR